MLQLWSCGLLQKPLSKAQSYAFCDKDHPAPEDDIRTLSPRGKRMLESMSSLSSRAAPRIALTFFHFLSWHAEGRPLSRMVDLPWLEIRWKGI